ncbi:MAG: hypothetical protein ACOVOD_07085, partial [Rhodoferax sp.]
MGESHSVVLHGVFSFKKRTSIVEPAYSSGGLSPPMLCKSNSIGHAHAAHLERNKPKAMAHDSRSTERAVHLPFLQRQGSPH